MMGESLADEQPDAPMTISRLRASHEDRDRVIETLRVAAGDGRLTAEELDQRLEAAFVARTYGDLAVLTADLPTSGQAVYPVPAAAPKDVVRIDIRSGHAERTGRWTVPSRMEVKIRSGHATIDFTEAAITEPLLLINVTIRSGHLTLIVKPGMAVESDDVSVRSGHIKVRTPWPDASRPHFLIRLSGQLGSGHILVRPPRRGFLDWLMRRPRPYAADAGRIR